MIKVKVGIWEFLHQNVQVFKYDLWTISLSLEIQSFFSSFKILVKLLQSVHTDKLLSIQS